VFSIIGFALEGFMECIYIVSDQQSRQSYYETGMSRFCFQLFVLNICVRYYIFLSMLLRILKYGVQKLHYTVFQIVF
jgi:hypothetical protein